MTKRERILAFVVLGMMCLVGVRYMYGRYQQMLSSRRAQLQAAKEQLADAQLALANGRRAVQLMEGWQQRSLPPDRGMAMSLYRTWLLEQLKSSGLTVDDVNPDLRSGQTSAYRSVGYMVEAHGSLESVVGLLYEFYRSPILQQITRLRLRPNADNPSQLDVSLRVEALILPGAINTDSLPSGSSNRLALASMDDYRVALNERNPFSVYVPPQPERAVVVEQPKPSPPPFDAAQHAYVTGIVESGGKLQAWITVRTTGEVLRLVEGDVVKVGQLEGRIMSISPRELVLQADDQQLRVQLGHSLRDEEKKEADEGANEGTS